MFSIIILAPEPPTFVLKNVFRSSTVQKYDNVHGLEIQKIKDYESENEIEQNINRANLLNSLLSIRSYKNIQQWTTDAKPIVYLFEFYR